MFSEKVSDKKLLHISWWIVLFIGLEFVEYTFLNNAALNAVNSIICDVLAIYVYFHYCNTKNEQRLGKKLFSIILGLWFFSILVGLIQGGTSLLRPYVLFMMLSNAFIALTIINKRIPVYPLKIIFYTVASYFVYLCLVKQVEVTEIFPRSGGGLMGTVILTLSIIIQYIEYRNYGKINLLTTIVALIVCILAYSRSSLICGVAYLFVVLFFSSRKYNSFLLRNGLLIILTSVTAYFVIENWDLIETLDIYDKFNKKGMDNDGRGDIWTAYLSRMDFFNILLGIPIDEAHKLDGFTNPHNSIIQLHSQIGVFAFVVVFYILRAIIRYLMKNPFLAALLAILLFRGFTDIAFFFAHFDYVIYVLVFEKTLKKYRVKDISVSLF